MLPLKRRFHAGALLVTLTVAGMLPRATAQVPRDARRQYMAGMNALLGQGRKQDIAEAARLLQSSADAGLPQAMVALAGLYDVGLGVPLDVPRSSAWRERAAKAGDETARGQIADDGKLPGQRDFRRASILTDLHQYTAALPWARKAADAGSANGLLLLGRAYHFGLGVPVDKAAAFKLYQRSSAAGLADGTRAVGYMYEFGLGVAVDRKLALVNYDRAAAAGSAIARQNAANLRSPDYDRARGGAGGGGGGSRSSDFQAFQCNGAGGMWNGSTCSQRNSNTIINP